MIGGVTSSVASVFERNAPAKAANGPDDAAKLKQRDAEVRQHEQAHKAAGGAYVHGGARFEYQRNMRV